MSGEIGLTLAQLQASVGSAYPLFFCGGPIDEPTCIPMRASSVNGSTTYDVVSTAGDSDGDGIADTSDNCPTVFNPVRPLAAGAQPDVDGDSLGDECDPTPVPEPGIAGGLRGLLCLVLAGAARRRHRS